MIYSTFIAPLKSYNTRKFENGYFKRYNDLSQLEKNDYSLRAAQYISYLDKKPSTLLDVGCGTGLLLEGFFKLGIDVYGTEISEEAINFASPTLKGKISKGSILDIQYPDDHFDTVTCVDVLEHIPLRDTDKALKELYRVTKKNLLLGICLWHERNARTDPTHINLHSRRFWLKKLASMGFTLSDMKEEKSFPENHFLIIKAE